MLIGGRRQCGVEWSSGLGAGAFLALLSGHLCSLTYVFAERLTQHSQAYEETLETEESGVLSVCVAASAHWPHLMCAHLWAAKAPT